MKLARTKEWRESHGLTQRELAAEAGVGEVTVARIETGASVTPPTARKIAEALGVAVADLLERPPVPLGEAPQETGRSGEETLSLAELNRRTLEYIDAIADQNRRASAQSEASEVIPQPYFVHGENEIVDLLSGERSDVAAQVVAEVGARLRLEVAERDLKIARLEAELETTERDNALLRQEIANLTAEREGAER